MLRFSVVLISLCLVPIAWADTADYMDRAPDETAAQHRERLMWEYVYARGGNKPEDVARWMQDCDDACWSARFLQDWGSIKVEDAEYVPATDAEIGAGKVELFAVTRPDRKDPNRAPGARGPVRDLPDAAVKLAPDDVLSRRAAGETVERKGDNRSHAEKWAYTETDMRAAAATLRGAR